MMDLARLRDLVDAHGSNLARWPQADRVQAEALLATELAARVYLQQARRLDEALAAPPDSARIRQQDDSAARICDALVAWPLPPQRRGLLSWRWPTLLLGVDLAPAWPRVAALACAAGLGIGIGLFSADARLFENRGGPAIAAPDADFAGLGFDAEPLTGVTP
jgi:hypothetical protein